MSAPACTFEIVTLFPEMFRSVLEGSLLGRAIERGLLAVVFTNPRDFGLGRHLAVDDAPYGGGGGMVLRPEPLVAAIEHAEGARGRAHRVLLSPAGARIDRAAVERLCRLPRLLLICGRYEGVDDRVGRFVDEELSLGDFVMTGGEIAAMALLDACARRLPGVLGNAASPVEESFEDGLLEHPHYTRPPEFRGRAVPDVLASGDHDRIRRYRRTEALLRTRERRPDVFARHRMTDEDRRLLAAAAAPDPRAARAACTYAALVHHPVLDRAGAVITTAVTNLDLHDLARSCRTYGLAGLFIVTPVAAQRDLCNGILDEWRRDGAARNDHRMDALATVTVVENVEQAEAEIERRRAARPRLVATSARAGTGRPLGFDEPCTEPERPILLLFGTGWGLAAEVLDRVDRVLFPIRGTADYNHLSVRSAAAVVLDRLFGERT